MTTPNSSLPEFKDSRNFSGLDSERSSDVKRTKNDVEMEGRADYFQLRNKWSHYLIRCLAASITFQFGLVVAVGMHWLDFTGHETFLISVGGEVFVQIAAMCLVATKCLFPPNPNKPKKKPDTER